MVGDTYFSSVNAVLISFVFQFSATRDQPITRISANVSDAPQGIQSMEAVLTMLVRIFLDSDIKHARVLFSVGKIYFQNQNNLLVKSQNDNHSPGPVTGGN